jgi:hypothetical protein
MIKKWVEIVCDYCDNAEYELIGGDWKARFKKSGGIITANNKHYCDKACYEKAKKEVKTNEHEKVG